MADGPARYAQSRAKLADCTLHGPGSGAELLLVEGDSAQDSVLAVRDERTQAVLPLQGKPLNAWTAPRERVEQQLLFQQIGQALGPEASRFERVVLLFDPDADGIHIGALMQLYFARWRPALIDAGALWLVRAPMFEIVDADGVVRHALTPPHRDRIVNSLSARPMVRALRGLGGFAPETLRRLCVDPATRLARAVAPDDIEQVLAVFGPR